VGTFSLASFGLWQAKKPADSLAVFHLLGP
jgi:hypothetical protein